MDCCLLADTWQAAGCTDVSVDKGCVLMVPIWAVLAEQHVIWTRHSAPFALNVSGAPIEAVFVLRLCWLLL